MRRVASVALAVLAVAVAAGMLARGDDDDAERPATRAPAAEVPDVAPPDPAPGPEVLSVRRRGGVPAAWRARLGSVPGTRAVAPVSRTQTLLRRTARDDGSVVDAPPAGYAIPLDALVVSARSFARVVPGESRAAVRRLRSGSVLLSESSARLRRLGAGGRLTLDGGRTVRIAAVVDDEIARGSELVLTGGAGRPGTSQLLVSTTRPDAVLRRLPDDGATRAAPAFVADAGFPQRAGIARALEVKQAFGEFAVRLPYGEDWVGIEPRWLRRHVVTRSVPVLGSVTCHEAMIAPLRRALGALRRRGLARLVDPGDYAGCYAPRRIPSSGSLSLHAWGLAIDLNASVNPQFGDSRQDPRLVRAMERAGFTWGGHWPTAPDPMHFELQPPD
jgi:hypothetical protein